MLLSFAYLAFSAVLRLLMGSRRREFTKDVELLVLRHQLVVLGRQQRRPSLRPADRAFLAALTRVLPQRRRHGFVVTPQTLLRWHRELVRRKWAQPRGTPGRPAVDGQVRQLVLRVGAENSVRLSPELDPGPARIPRAPRESVLSAPTVFSFTRAREYQTASSLARWIGSPPRRVSVGFEERPATQRFCTRATSRRAGRDGGGDRAAATQHVAPAH
jgi:hypothetical protein